MGQVDCKRCSNGTFVAEKDRPASSAVSCRACPYGKECVSSGSAVYVNTTAILTYQGVSKVIRIYSGFSWVRFVIGLRICALLSSDFDVEVPAYVLPHSALASYMFFQLSSLVHKTVICDWPKCYTHRMPVCFKINQLPPYHSDILLMAIPLKINTVDR